MVHAFICVVKNGTGNELKPHEAKYRCDQVRRNCLDSFGHSFFGPISVSSAHAQSSAYGCRADGMAAELAVPSIHGGRIVVLRYLIANPFNRCIVPGIVEGGAH
ncbi:hypothetical protein D3C73_1258190 [compost metagenome]